MELQIDVFNCNHTITKCIYVIFDDVPKLLDYLEELTRNTDDTYLIHNGSNSRARAFGKHNPPILYRCMSCGAAIRKDDKYHKLHVKGQPFIFCKLCVELSDHIAFDEGK